LLANRQLVLLSIIPAGAKTILEQKQLASLLMISLMAVFAMNLVVLQSPHNCRFLKMWSGVEYQEVLCKV
jgi:hypothetical protein